jgi:hypothetical protein
MVFQVSHNCFLPNPLQFIIQQSFESTNWQRRTLNMSGRSRTCDICKRMGPARGLLTFRPARWKQYVPLKRRGTLTDYRERRYHWLQLYSLSLPWDHVTSPLLQIKFLPFYIPIFLLYFFPSLSTFLLPSVPSFLHSYLPSFLHSYLPPFLLSFLSTFPSSFFTSFSLLFTFLLPSFPSFLHSYLPPFLPTVLPPSYVPSYLPTFLPSFHSSSDYIPPILSV